ncbi:hypothetical protein ACWC3X_11770 [Streptomyces populi]
MDSLPRTPEGRWTGTGGTYRAAIEDVSAWTVGDFWCSDRWHTTRAPPTCVGGALMVS